MADGGTKRRRGPSYKIRISDYVMLLDLDSDHSWHDLARTWTHSFAFVYSDGRDASLNHLLTTSQATLKWNYGTTKPTRQDLEVIATSST